MSMSKYQNEAKKLFGLVVFMRTNIGSRSECVIPFLYVGKARFIYLWVPCDNPFENLSLKDFDGKRVLISGDYGENNIFYVGKIEECDAAPKDTELFQSIESTEKAETTENNDPETKNHITKEIPK